MAFSFYYSDHDMRDGDQSESVDMKYAFNEQIQLTFCHSENTKEKNIIRRTVKMRTMKKWKLEILKRYTRPSIKQYDTHTDQSIRRATIIILYIREIV